MSYDVVGAERVNPSLDSNPNLSMCRFRGGADLFWKIVQIIYEKNTEMKVQMLFSSPLFFRIGVQAPPPFPSFFYLSRSAPAKGGLGGGVFFETCQFGKECVELQLVFSHIALTFIGPLSGLISLM